MALVIEIYKITGHFPNDEMYGLKTQVRRAVISIPSNIAEGAARQTKKEFIQFLHVAQGSLSELDTQLEIALRLRYVDESSKKKVDELMEPIDKMIARLIRHLRDE